MEVVPSASIRIPSATGIHNSVVIVFWTRVKCPGGKTSPDLYIEASQHFLSFTFTNVLYSSLNTTDIKICILLGSLGDDTLYFSVPKVVFPVSLFPLYSWIFICIITLVVVKIYTYLCRVEREGKRENKLKMKTAF